jgi:iron complex transport system substrate-binding protein
MKNILFILLLALLFSCTGEKRESETPRYVVTSPEVGEIVYLLQGTKNIVGVTEETDYPLPLQKIAKVGRFGAVSREKIIALEPTLVFTSGLEQEFLAHELSKAGIVTVLIYPQSLSALLSGIEEVARYLEIEERGKTVVDSLREEINFLRFEGEERPRVYIEIYGDPIMSVSRNSFVGELIEIAGGENIFTELPRDYSRVRAEDVIRSDPEIIILTYPGVTPREIKFRKGWQYISACRNDRIYGVEDLDPDLILRAGPRITEGLRILKRVFQGI